IMFCLGNNNFSRKSYFSKTKRDKLSFIDDSTYRYEYSFGYHRMLSEGHYELNGDNFDLLFLESYYQKKGDSLYINADFNEVIDDKSDSLTIIILDQIPVDEMYSYTIVINKKAYETENSKVLKLKLTEEIKSIQLNIKRDSNFVTNIFPLRYIVYSNIYKPKRMNSNYFTINWDIKGDVFYFEPLMDTLEIKGKSCIGKKGILF
ncbi:MAG: hypothetical protein HC830_10300, partial [Bacteroidetes bacterium]|nr:hypothetical protein [Bacteroidota bacterium]